MKVNNGKHHGLRNLDGRAGARFMKSAIRGRPKKKKNERNNDETPKSGSTLPPPAIHARAPLYFFLCLFAAPKVLQALPGIIFTGV